MTRSSPAIVCTVRGLDASFLTWLYHHKNLGFQHIYLVFDAPDEDRKIIKQIASVPSFGGVVHLIENDAAHQERIRSFPQYAQLRSKCERVVVSRQMLNVAVVMQHAMDDGVTWLLHLDADELIAPHTSGASVLPYLEQVPDQYDEVIFPNFEAVPESEEIANPFTDVTLFKKSPYYMRYREFEYLYTAWNGNSGTFKLFNAYITGKSALRMRDVDVPFVPYSVHHFLPVRFNRNVLIEDRGGPIVLHYAHCGLRRFVGRFTGFNRDRVNTYDGSGFTEDLYLQARELVTAQREDELPALYHRLVMLDDPKLRARLLRNGFLVRRDWREEGHPEVSLPVSASVKYSAQPDSSRRSDVDR